MGPEELLNLDDFALAVLVDRVASSQIHDGTLRDLARRIRTRDLFKRVPVSSETLHRFRLEADWKGELREAIRPYCTSGDPEFYLVLDEAEFGMLSDADGEKAFLVDEAGRATFVSDHTEFASQRGARRTEYRLYTLREGVEAAKGCIEAANLG